MTQCLNVRGLEDINGDCVLDVVVACSGTSEEVRVSLSSL